MGYLLERDEAIRDTDVVAVISVPRKGAKSRLVLRNGAIRHTLTRPSTLRRYFCAEALKGVRWPNVQPHHRA